MVVVFRGPVVFRLFLRDLAPSAPYYAVRNSDTSVPEKVHQPNVCESKSESSDIVSGISFVRNALEYVVITVCESANFEWVRRLTDFLRFTTA